ncbi:3-deoxy-7-phosphoheptulonate synthase [Ignisphaera sp. 4213-co]|uniref:3-deoxy-7-phosphoheptulonate synthase n=1 Tax=Ignisphaera cupida TaxID=3050454 RepID=A0ABD4Z4G6_9CREN|nr:3-deoxy-7-phosphoheptulonate synthase [Ignisphaera sp. 4213-co]MDK6028094.1 3-deoxy-7-phosphoheptulonate synthase [Ignisphaera sp. 4213-co]
MKNNSNGLKLIEKLKEKSASYKVVDLYKRKIVVAWPDKLVENVIDDDVELKVRVSKPWQLASNEWKKDKTIVNVDGIEIGGRNIVVAAGPCAIEDEDIAIEIAKAVKKAGAKMFRGGAYKPRTSPYTFQGLGENGLKILRKVYEVVGLPIVTEVMDTRDVEKVASFAHMLQIGARNSQNFPLLREVGKAKKPVLLKRGMSMTTEEWLLAAEYILLESNGDVVLCERGIRTFEKNTRFTLDLAGLAYVKTVTHLPLAVDPSHPAGRRDLVEPLALAAIAAGADMLIVEVHIAPEKALSDSEQQLTISMFEELMKKLKMVAEALGRSI